MYVIELFLCHINKKNRTGIYNAGIKNRTISGHSAYTQLLPCK